MPDHFLDAARCRQDFTPHFLKNWIIFRLQVGKLRGSYPGGPV